MRHCSRIKGIFRGMFYRPVIELDEVFNPLIHPHIILNEVFIKNGVTDEGLNDILDVMFHDSTQTSTWYVGLIDNSGSPSLSDDDTLASHGGWSEFNNYADDRKGWAAGAASSKSITNGSTFDFTMNASGTVYGLFVCGAATGTAAKLWSTAALGSPQAVNSGDVFKGTYTVSIDD